MYSRIIVLSCLIPLFMVVENVNGESKFFQPPEECRNEPLAGQARCLENFCLDNKDKFVCQAYECKQGNDGNGIIQQLAKLKCIENVCDVHPTKTVCQELKICQEKKNAGLFKFIECILILFSEK